MDNQNPMPNRKADDLVEGSSRGLGSTLKLIATKQIALWKALIFSLFLAGFVSALAFAAAGGGFSSLFAASSVSITSPAKGATVSGTVSLSAAVDAAIGAVKVTFRVDGNSVGTDTAAPFSLPWDTAKATDGSHTLRAFAYNAAGTRVGISPVGYNVTVSNGTGGGPVCGNGVCEPGEDAQSCPADCGGNPAVCGNGVKEGNEQCDGLDGTQCPSGYSGTAVCESCRLNTSGCQAPPPAAGFIRRQGKNLVDGTGRQIYLRGTNFTGYFSVDSACKWYTEGYAEDNPHYPYPTDSTHRVVSLPAVTGSGQCQTAREELEWYDESHYAKAKEIGFNVVRLPLHYKMFEDKEPPASHKQAGWEYLNMNIDWAKKQGIYLILDMHVPQGGFGNLNDTPKNGGGGGKLLWTETGSNGAQVRFKNLWREIARRYANETIIAGYDILNEPHPIGGASVWLKLANDTISEIRSVDRNHMIVVESVNWIDNPSASDWSIDLVKSFQILASDPLDNIMYDMHDYMPEEYVFFQDVVTEYPSSKTVIALGDPDDPARVLVKKTFTAQYLKDQIDIIANKGSWQNYPVNVGEWASGSIFFDGITGGVAYMKDMIVAFDQHGVHWDHYAMPQLYAGDNLNGSLIPARACVFQEYFGTGTCAGGGGPVCGNGQCESGETSASCPADCGSGGGGNLPDYIIQSLSVTADASGRYCQGAAHSVRVTVSNAGAAASASSRTRVAGPSGQICTKSINALGAGAHSSFNCSWTPANTGSALIAANADQAEVIQESDETNNSKSMSANVVTCD